jgi:hypothetical protein
MTWGFSLGGGLATFVAVVLFMTAQSTVNQVHAAIWLLIAAVDFAAAGIIRAIRTPALANPAPVRRAAPTSAEPPPFPRCRQCGGVVTPGQKVCPSCGARV